MANMRIPVEHNVLTVFNLRDKAGREIFAGLLEAMEDKDEWHLTVLQPGECFTARDVRDGNYDGFIVTMPGTSDAMEALTKTKTPTVLVNITDRRLSARTDSVSFVWGDGADIGQKAARHLLKRGDYAAFGYVHELRPEFYSDERESAFRQTLRRAGHASSAFPPDKDYAAYLPRLKAWLRELPKPAAVMAVSDMRAADVINACREEGLDVPGQVSVIGVDNDLSQHRKCGLAISSVLPDWRAMGRQAAEELSFLFAHPNRSGRPHEILIPVREIISRESSARSVPAAKLVQQAIEFIEARKTENIRRKDVVTHLHCSLQLAELRFKQIRNASIRETIEAVRMAEVDRRLRHGPVTLKELAKDLHFTSANQLSRIYKRHFGRCATQQFHS